MRLTDPSRLADVGWEGIINPDHAPGQPAQLGIGVEEMYIDILEGVPESQRSLVLGGEVSVWTDNYTAPTLGLQ